MEENNKSQHFPNNLTLPGAVFLSSLMLSVSISGAVLYANSGLRANLYGSGPSGQGQPVPTADGEGLAGDAEVFADVTLGDIPYLGSENAPVEIVEFADFQCPFCGRFYSDVEIKLVEEYVNTGKAKFAFRDFSFLGDESYWAANAARCANDQGKFWDFHDYLYTHQNGENQGAFSKENLKKFGREIGLNTATFNACVDADTHKDAVAADTEAGRAAGVNGTPATFINGKMIAGAQSYSVFKEAIDAALGL